MELRQLRSFVKVVEAGSISRAALALDLVQSALSQQITRLEGELGLAPTTAAVLGLPFMQAMRVRYPDVRLHMVESLSGHLSAMLNARQLDLAVLFDSPIRASQHLQTARRWRVGPLIEEDIFLIAARSSRPAHAPTRLSLADLAQEPLILPTGPHGLRSTLNAAFARPSAPPAMRTLEGVSPKVMAPWPRGAARFFRGSIQCAFPNPTRRAPHGPATQEQNRLGHRGQRWHWPWHRQSPGG